MGRVKGNALTPRADKGRNLGESGRSFGKLYINGTVVEASVGAMSPSAPVAAAIEDYDVTVERTGNIIKTTMYIELKGLKSTATTGDIIGDTGASHIGQITTAVNGVIFKGQVSCAVVPTTGDDDIDIYSATEGTGAYDADIGDLTETQLVDSGGSYAIGTVKPFTALPAANSYLYLTAGATTAGEYDAGKIIIEMWGLAA